jgi:hypothetical protein
MGVFGNLLGQAVGRAIGQKAGGGKGANAGQQVGGMAGNLLPFKKGGKVPGKKGAPKVIMAHGGEYVLPVGVKPTKAQKAMVAKGKAKK